MARQAEQDGRSLLHFVLRTLHFWQAWMALLRGYDDLIRVAARFFDDDISSGAPNVVRSTPWSSSAIGTWTRD